MQHTSSQTTRFSPNIVWQQPKKKNKLCNRSTNRPKKLFVNGKPCASMHRSGRRRSTRANTQNCPKIWTTNNVQIKSLGSTNILIMIFFCGGAPLESLICFWWVYEIYDFWWNPFWFGIFFLLVIFASRNDHQETCLLKSCRVVVVVVEGETGAMWLNFDWFCGGVPTDSQRTNQPADRATYSNRHMFAFQWKFQYNNFMLSGDQGEEHIIKNIILFSKWHS